MLKEVYPFALAHLSLVSLNALERCLVENDSLLRTQERKLELEAKSMSNTYAN